MGRRVNLEERAFEIVEQIFGEIDRNYANSAHERQRIEKARLYRERRALQTSLERFLYQGPESFELFFWKKDSREVRRALRGTSHSSPVPGGEWEQTGRDLEHPFRHPPERLMQVKVSGKLLAELGSDGIIRPLPFPLGNRSKKAEGRSTRSLVIESNRLLILVEQSTPSSETRFLRPHFLIKRITPKELPTLLSGGTENSAAKRIVAEAMAAATEKMASKTRAKR